LKIVIPSAISFLCSPARTLPIAADDSHDRLGRRARFRGSHLQHPLTRKVREYRNEALLLAEALLVDAEIVDLLDGATLQTAPDRMLAQCVCFFPRNPEESGGFGQRGDLLHDKDREGFEQQGPLRSRFGPWDSNRPCPVRTAFTAWDTAVESCTATSRLMSVIFHGLTKPRSFW
jgi:hypothetical protein